MLAGFLSPELEEPLNGNFRKDRNIITPPGVALIFEQKQYIGL